MLKKLKLSRLAFSRDVDHYLEEKVKFVLTTKCMYEGLVGVSKVGGDKYYRCSIEVEFDQVISTIKDTCMGSI